MATDFFDDDLLRREAAQQSLDESDKISMRPLSDASLTRMMKQKEDVMHQVASATQEMEQLRLRQEQLEKEKTDLLEMTHRQEDYERAKREIIEKLVQSMVMLEKEESQATRMAELASMMRTRFKDAMNELKSIDEQKWTDDIFQMELNKAMVLVEDARNTYSKALAKIEAARWQKTGTESGALGSLEEIGVSSSVPRGFAERFRMGFAFFLPLMILIVILFLVQAMLRGY